MKKYIFIAVTGLIVLGTIESRSVDYFLKGLKQSKRFYEGKVKTLKKHLSQKGLMSQQKLFYETALEKQQKRANHYQNLINKHKKNPQKSIAASRKRFKQAKESGRLQNLYQQLVSKRNRLQGLESSNPGSAEAIKVKKEITNIEDQIITLESR